MPREQRRGIKSLPGWEEQVRRYRPSIYAQQEQERRLQELLQKYGQRPPQSNFINPRPPVPEIYSISPDVWGYAAGMLIHNQPAYGGNLDNRIGVGKAIAHWRDRNNDVGLELGAGGNHNINWTHSF